MWVAHSITGHSTLSAGFGWEGHLVSDSAGIQEHRLHQHPQHNVFALLKSHGLPYHSLQRCGSPQRTWQDCCG